MASVAATAGVCQWMAVRVVLARRDSGVQYPAMVAEGTDEAAMKFNCTQRAHQNTLVRWGWMDLRGAQPTDRFDRCREEMGGGSGAARCWTTRPPPLPMFPTAGAVLPAMPTNLYRTALCLYRPVPQEYLPNVLAMQLVLGLAYPVPAAIAGIVWALGRVVYALGEWVLWVLCGGGGVWVLLWGVWGVWGAWRGTREQRGGGRQNNHLRVTP